MQVVAAVVARLHARRVVRVAQQRVEIGHLVKLPAFPDPPIDLAAHRVLGGRVVGVEGRALQRAFERQQRAADDAHAARVRLRDQLPVRGDHARRRHRRFLRRERALRPADIVYPHQHHHRMHARLRQHVLLEARGRIGTHAVAQQARAGDACIDHRHAAGAEVPGELVGPAPVTVGRRAIAVGDGVAECDHRARRCRRIDPDPRQQGAAVQRRRTGQCGGRGDVAGGDMAGLLRAPMEGGQRRFLRQVDADGQFFQCRQWHLQRIADCGRAGRNDGAALAAEGQHLIGTRRDAAVGPGGARHVRIADHQRLAAVAVGQHDAHAPAAHADARRFAHGLLRQGVGDAGRQHEISAAPGGVRAGLPAGDPVFRRMQRRGECGRQHGSGDEFVHDALLKSEEPTIGHSEIARKLAKLTILYSNME
jgi:hypothetical protein